MILAIDVHYKEDYAKTVGVLFKWDDDSSKENFESMSYDIEEYESGQFYKRELPCIIELLKKIDLTKVDTIIIDGFVYVSNEKKLGLGAYLYEYLGKKIPIIGVAKKRFHNTEDVCLPVFRGQSKVPLYVSSIGIDNLEVANKIEKMHGAYRIPDILKYLDVMTKKKYS